MSEGRPESDAAAAPRWRRLVGAAAGPALVVSVATLASRAVGFGRTLVFSATVGNTATGSVYNRANLVPNVLFEVVAGGVLAAVVVPLLAAGLAEGGPRGRAEADRSASALLTWALTLLVPLAVAVAVLAHPLAGLLIRGENVAPGAIDLGADLLRMFAVQLPLYGLGAVLGGVLQAHRRFLWPALVPLLSSLVVIVAYLGFAALVSDHARLEQPPLLGGDARWMLGAGTTAGVAALTLPLLVPVRRAGIRLRPCWRFPPGTVRIVVSLAAAGVGGVVAQQIAVLTVAATTRGIDGGRILTLVGYAQAVTLMPHAVLVVPVITTTFPRLAAAFASGRGQDANALVARTTSVVVVVGLLGSAGQIGAAEAMERFFTGLDAGGVHGLAAGLIAYAPGVALFGLLLHLSRVLSAAHHARAVATGVALGWLVAAAGSTLVMIDSAGSPGPLVVLGVANSVGMAVGAGFLIVAVRRELGSAALGGLLRIGVASAVAAAAAAAVGAGVSELLLDTAPSAAQSVGTYAAAMAVGVLAALITTVVYAAVAVVGLPERGRALRAVLRKRAGGTPADEPSTPEVHG